MRPPVTRSLQFLVLLVLCVLLGSLASPTSAHADTPRTKRVLLISAPRLVWADIDKAKTPALASFVANAAVANLSMRTIGPRTTLAEAYATIGAGNRAAVNEDVAGAIVANRTTETDVGFDSDDDGAAWQRRLAAGGDLTAPEVVAPALGVIDAQNKRLHYGSVIGSLGHALINHGGAAVIAQADSPLRPGQPVTERREAGLAVVDYLGRADGQVDGLGVKDPAAAYGERLDDKLVVAAVARALPTHAVTLVELSDLERADAERALSLPTAAKALWDKTLAASDALFARVAALADEDTTVMLFGAASPRSLEQLSVFAMTGPGIETGLVQSGTTRRPGYVTLSDIGPDILDRLALDTPDDMAGAPFAVTKSSNGERSIERFVRSAERTTFRDKATGPANATFVILQVLVYLAGAFALARRNRKAQRVFGVLALGILAIPPLGFLAGAIPADGLGVAGFVVVLMLSGFAVGAAVAFGMRNRHPLAAIAALAGFSFGVQVVDIATGGRLQLDTVFGYSPVVAGRFAGFGNLSYAILAGTAIVLAAAIIGLTNGVQRSPGSLRKVLRSPGWWAAGAVLALTVLVDGLPSMGSDVGGVLANIPAFAVLIALLAAIRLQWPKIVAIGVATIGVLGLFAVIDLQRPAASRTHLGRLVARVGNDPSYFGDVINRKVSTNLNILTSSVWTLLIPVAVVFLGALVWRSSRYLEAMAVEVPGVRPTIITAFVACGLGFALNDSGVVVPAMMLAILLPMLTWFVAVLDLNESLPE